MTCNRKANNDELLLMSGKAHRLIKPMERGSYIIIKKWICTLLQWHLSQLPADKSVNILKTLSVVLINKVY